MQKSVNSLVEFETFSSLTAQMRFLSIGWLNRVFIRSFRANRRISARFGGPFPLFTWGHAQIVTYGWSWRVVLHLYSSSGNINMLKHELSYVLCFKVSKLKNVSLILLHLQIRNGYRVNHYIKTWHKNTQFMNEVSTLSEKTSHLQVEIELPQKEDKGVQFLLSLSVSSDSRVPLFILNSTSSKEKANSYSTPISQALSSTQQGKITSFLYNQPIPSQTWFVCKPIKKYVIFYIFLIYLLILMMWSEYSPF